MPSLVSAGISFVIFFYVAMRAATLSITHDEALTYAWHVTGDWLQIVLFKTPGLPDNNHLLHTLLCKISVTLFGLSELTLRLPSLLGCILYLAGLNICLKRIVPGWLQVLGLLLAGMNPYVLDFMGLARGYGLGLGFTMLGLAALLASLADSPGKVRQTPALLSLLFFLLAVLANISFLLVLMAALAILSAPLVYAGISARPDHLTPRDSSPWIVLLKIILLTLPLFAYLTVPLGIINKHKLFEMGGSSGFWVDTVGSLIDGTIYDRTWLDDQHSLLEVWVMATLLAMPLLLWSLRRTDSRRFASLAVIVMMVALIALESLLQHAILKVALLQGRRGIVLIPLFLLAALMMGNLIKVPFRLTAIVGLLLGVAIPVVLVVNGMLSMNIKYVSDWRDDACSRDIMLAVRDKIVRQKPTVPLHMRVNWVFEPSTNFYRHTMGLESSLLPLNRKGLDGPADLYYGYTRDQGLITKYSVRLLKREPFSDTVLFERADSR
ncbi:MAG: hypothetical protein HGB22_08890 [Chlorobiaceae bacterium]|nr:hypothetical protein [Chlorobiaceae bacterium]